MANHLERLFGAKDYQMANQIRRLRSGQALRRAGREAA